MSLLPDSRGGEEEEEVKKKKKKNEQKQEVFRAVARTPKYVDLYSARIHQLSGAQGALLPLLIRLIRLINHS